jgi:1-hydroxycarotenoid 3,4-desaturase
VTTDPARFAQRFPGSGGSLYGRANHGPLASFARPGARSAIRGLYLAGGSVHPGAGVPMSAMSGRLAAAALLEDAA